MAQEAKMAIRMIPAETPRPLAVPNRLLLLELVLEKEMEEVWEGEFERTTVAGGLEAEVISVIIGACTVTVEGPGTCCEMEG